MKIIECMHTQNDCYAKNVRLNSNVTHIGVVVHSTGANNTNLKRYVQPSNNDPNRAELLKLIGTNTSNSWNRSGVQKAVHYFIGELADGTLGIAQNLPENYFCWGSGKGSKGNYNYEPNAHIQFEMCEDKLTNADYFRAIMGKAQELCADICLRHGWNANVIVSHREAHAKGYGSNHADIDHWLAKFQKDMNWFRSQVQTLIDAAKAPKEPEKPAEPETGYAPSVNETVEYVGTIHYSSSNSTSPKTCKPGVATVTRLYNGKHPYHLVNMAGDKDGVYGWVDSTYIKKLDTPVEKVEDPKVEIEDPKVEVESPQVEPEQPTSTPETEEPKIEVEESNAETDDPTTESEEPKGEVEVPEVEVEEPQVEVEPSKSESEPLKEPPVETPLTQPTEPEVIDIVSASKTSGAIKKLISWLVKIIKKIFSK